MLGFDGQDYNVLEQCVKDIKNVEGTVCQIGIRGGGSSAIILTALYKNGDFGRNMIDIDCFGGLFYEFAEGKKEYRDHTNVLRNQVYVDIYTFLKENDTVNYVLIPLSDIDYFTAFPMGFVFYDKDQRFQDYYYSFVFLDAVHSENATLSQLEFFMSRMSKDGIILIDDWDTFPFNKCKEVLKANNFKEHIKSEHKIAYRKVK